MTSARAQTVLGPVVFLALLLLLWETGVINDTLGVERFALPHPSEIVDALSEHRGELAEASGETFLAVAIGYVLGNAVGFAFALVLLRLPGELADRVGAAGAAVQSLPIVATAPVISLWIKDPLLFKAAVVVVMTFPSMLVFGYRGMTGIDSKALALAASYNASRRQVLTMIRLPSAAPQILTALKYTVVLALIGVVVSEILVAFNGLGRVIEEKLGMFDAPEAWAAVLILGAAGILAYVALAVLERMCFPWAMRADAD
jgi:NitT/TauT family transport system permease protein